MKEKRVLVAGTGKSGIGAAKLLIETGHSVLLYDENRELDENVLRAKLPAGADVRICLGELTKETAAEAAYCVISPGIPLEAAFVPVLEEAGVEIRSEIELAYRQAKGRLAAITGTNGKTTTTALTGAILSSVYPETYMVGNIGIPYTEEAGKMSGEAVTAAEVSSFQLETIRDFHPEVSAILNITPDHLNRHKTMENYIAVKESITKNQTEKDTCVLNYEDEELRRFGETLSVRVLYFSSKRTLEEGLFLRGGGIFIREDGAEEELCRTEELKLVGVHNYENVMAAAAVALRMGVPLADIREACKNFRAVEHRIEYVTEENGVVYYNDSKGTNPDAAIKGIEAMSRPTVLIGGGYDKQSEYREWLKACKSRVTALILIGETAEKIAGEAKEVGLTEIVFAADMEEAVAAAKAKARPGDAVLLSPACASWDMFESYEQRGRIFKDCVRRSKGV
ncbi:MAG: UDP-N-acetylmuramoyl-L-alanine--D-glutamate ligase [Lachnospiraceae bacterium]|nr:UDP-N-acetylmuramoyl-L-alanine--D-glutamate ligase [Lachnospiraceae bacterium]